MNNKSSAVPKDKYFVVTKDDSVATVLDMPSLVNTESSFEKYKQICQREGWDTNFTLKDSKSDY